MKLSSVKLGQLIIVDKTLYVKSGSYRLTELPNRHTYPIHPAQELPSRTVVLSTSR